MRSELYDDNMEGVQEVIDDFRKDVEKMQG